MERSEIRGGVSHCTTVPDFAPLHPGCKRGPPARYFVARSKKFTSAARSSAEPMRCSGILGPGV
jgi:hypothetical protein